MSFLRGGEEAIALDGPFRLYGELSPSEYVVYRLLHDCGPVFTNRAQLADWAGVSCDKAHKALKVLDDRRLIRYASPCAGGIDIWWVDGHGTMVPPKNPYSIQLVSPNGDRYRVSMGKYRSFAKAVGIHPASFYALKNGRAEQHKGWRIS